MENKRIQSWSWAENQWETKSIELRSTVIVWSVLGPKDLGGATDQKIEDYVANGPWDATCPREYLNALAKSVRELPAEHWEELKMHRTIEAENSRQLTLTEAEQWWDRLVRDVAGKI